MELLVPHALNDDTSPLRYADRLLTRSQKFRHHENRGM